MSWNEFTVYDIEPVLFVHNGHIALAWTCPRCDQEQVVNVDPSGLEYGQEIACANVTVCGEEQAVFQLRLEIECARYKGLTDRPLEREG